MNQADRKEFELIHEKIDNIKSEGKLKVSDEVSKKLEQIVENLIKIRKMYVSKLIVFYWFAIFEQKRKQ